MVKFLLPVWALSGGTSLLAVGHYLWPYLNGGTVPPLRELGAAIVFVGVLGGAVFAISHGPFRAMVLDERKSSGDCLHCGYPLRSSGCTQSRCPECGKEKEVVCEEENKNRS